MNGSVIWVCRECKTGFEEGGEECPSCGGSLVRIHFQGRAGEGFQDGAGEEEGGISWMSEERKIRERRRRTSRDVQGFWGFVLIVLGGAVAVLLSMIV